ncbi:MAG TPA: serine/threonine-protein kinase [Polyangia bacterium]
MAPDLCPYCGKAAHGTETNFDCPGRSDTKTVVTGAPAIALQTDTPNASPSRPSSAFDKLDASLGTKLSEGTKVGEYQIQDRIGEGGMGTVYSAVHPIIGKKVAIKVLSARLAKNKNAICRFVLEARAVNDIQHPGLVDIFSFGRLTDGRHYYVMEFLEGRNLGDVLCERVSLPISEALPIFLEVGRTLVAVHSKGIVHRDLKPENILLLSAVQPGGQKVKLVDFGLAKLVEGVPAHLSAGGPRTAAGVNVGTPHYMSPEQCRGQKVDARSDLYALGVLLYETLTGRLPFDGPTPLDIWQAHVEKAPRPPVDLAPTAVSPAMNAIILRLLAKKAAQRIQTAADFCTALDDLDDDGQPKHSASDSARLAASHKPVNYDELTTTTEDLPAVQLPEVAFSEEDRRQEIEELRSSLGLHIEEPASDSQEEKQMSALVIDLGSSHASLADCKNPPRTHEHSLPLLRAGPKVGRVTRPIQERQYVPPLSAPSPRGGGPARATTDIASRPPSHAWTIVRAALVAVLLIAATVVAVKFIK